MAHLLTQTRFRSTIESLLREFSSVISERRSGTRLAVRKRRLAKCRCLSMVCL